MSYIHPTLDSAMRDAKSTIELRVHFATPGADILSKSLRKDEKRLDLDI